MKVPNERNLFSAPALLIVMLMALLTVLGCGDDDSGMGDAAVEASSDAQSDDAETADAEPDVSPPPSDECEVLFGQPSERTGLSDGWCQPSCSCGEPGASGSPPSGGERWTFPDYTEADLVNLESLAYAPEENADPSLAEVLGADPYRDTELVPERDASRVCAMLLLDDGRYGLSTFESREAAEVAGHLVTHGGDCGRCSSMQDLAVYLRNPDLTDPVRECALMGLSGDDAAVVTCLEELGFTDACAETWAYNARNTREQCLAVCVAALSASYHLPDGSPNECIQCDEDLSGPVFKAVAGRTRRNSGIPTALCRPCDGVMRVVHRYE